MTRRTAVAVLALALSVVTIQGQTSTISGDRVRFGGSATTTPFLSSGSGTPEGAVAAPVGSMYANTANGDIYRKLTGTGNTGWTLLSTGGGGGGTVTSVGLSLPATFSVSGSPVTTSGTLSGTWVSVLANRVFAGATSGGSSAPTFRALVADDIPSVTSAMIANATIVFADWASNGCLSGEIPKWNGSTWACATDAGAGSGAPDSAQYLTLATDATLTNERVLTAGTGISFADGGAGSTLTVNGAPPWSSIANPTGNLSLTMAANTSTLTWNATTSTSNLFVLRDTTSNTGTGYLLDVGTASSSTAKPFRVQSVGSDVLTVDAAGVVRMENQYASPEHDAGNSGTALTIDWNNGNQQRLVLTGNCTFTLSNPLQGGRYMLVITQDATGSRTITWPSSVKWAGGVAPTLTTTASAIDICTLAYTGAGSGIYVAACNLDNK